MSERETPRQKAFSAVFQNALFSWQVGITLVFTVLLFFLAPTPFSFWQPWFWFLGGGATAGAFLLANLSDPDAAREAIARRFESQYDLSEIKNQVSVKRLKSALEYRSNMVRLTKNAKGSLKIHLLQTVADIDDWLHHMYELAQHIDAFEANKLVERDRRMVPQQLEKAKIRMEHEKDAKVKQELERQIQQLEQQWANLESTANSVKRAEIQLETTLASLATVYAQMTNLGAKEVDSARAQRLRLEIQDEVAGLQDTLEAMDEVQAQSLRLS